MRQIDKDSFSYWINPGQQAEPFVHFQEDLPLLTTIAAGLSMALLCGLIASKLRMSPIVGYLIAGILLGPYTPGLEADLKIAEELSGVGIVLLMFGVGLHFSMRDLMDVKSIAIPGAVVQIVSAIIMGVFLSRIWEWPLASGVMFGLALSVASTVVMLRALEANNLLQTTQGRIAVGWLIVEDLVMILALILIPTLAGIDSQIPVFRSSWEQVPIAMAKIVLFLITMFVVGKRFLPWLLTITANRGSRELFNLAVFATAVGMAFFSAALFDVSAALGAFFAGMMINGSNLNHEVADRALPFQDAFAVLFFVSVGMLFNPAILINQPGEVMAVVGVIVVGKSLAALAIVMALGYPIKTGLLIAAGLAQIGEFSFVLVALGKSYQLLTPEACDLVLAGAMISIALNPLLFKGARCFYEYVGRSPRLSSLFNVFEDDLAHLPALGKEKLDGHVILIGHGRVGRYISQNVQGANMGLVVIDQNRAKIEKLRERGILGIAGDGGHKGVLREAQVDTARAVAIAIPSPFEVRRIVEMVRAINPFIKILVRAHNDDEVDYFHRQSVDLAVTGPKEIGRRMVEHLYNTRDGTVTDSQA